VLRVRCAACAVCFVLPVLCAVCAAALRVLCVQGWPEPYSICGAYTVFLARKSLNKRSYTVCINTVLANPVCLAEGSCACGLKA